MDARPIRYFIKDDPHFASPKKQRYPGVVQVPLLINDVRCTYFALKASIVTNTSTSLPTRPIL